VKGGRWKVGSGHWCSEWSTCLMLKMYRRLSLPSRCSWWRVRSRWRLGGGGEARGGADERTVRTTHDARRGLAPQKGR
jgi:hypothetical protein